MALIIFILILAVLVLVHEFGHFIVAKRAGVLVEEFGFGFPPRLWGFKMGETLYSINLIPLGGFVKLYGEEYAEEDVEESGVSTQANRAFFNKKAGAKSAIVLAGVVMNILLASVLYFGLLATNSFKSNPIVLFSHYRFPFGHQLNEVAITGVSKNSPAQRAGIKFGDAITGFKGQGEQSFTPIASADMLIKKIGEEQNKKVQLQLVNIQNGKAHSVAVVPTYNKDLKRAAIGIGLAEVATVSYVSPSEKALSGFYQSYNMAAYSFSVFGDLIGQSIATKNFAPVGEAVSGPVGIFYAVSDTVRSSGEKVVRNLIDITAILSISLAVVNTLPFPALDGGRFAFILYEAISRRRVNKTVEKYINTAGIVVLLGLALVISINDIIKLINLPR